MTNTTSQNKSMPNTMKKFVFLVHKIKWNSKQIEAATRSHECRLVKGKSIDHFLTTKKDNRGRKNIKHDRDPIMADPKQQFQNNPTSHKKPFDAKHNPTHRTFDHSQSKKRNCSSDQKINANMINFSKESFQFGISDAVIECRAKIDHRKGSGKNSGASDVRKITKPQCRSEQNKKTEHAQSESGTVDQDVDSFFAF